MTLPMAIIAGAIAAVMVMGLVVVASTYLVALFVRDVTRNG